MMPRCNELGTLVENAVTELNSIGWKSFVHARRGRTCLAATVSKLKHPAATLLDGYRTEGVNVELKSPPWGNTQLQQAIDRGSHPSAKNYIGFLEADMTDMIKKGYWAVLPYNEVSQLPGLRLSPIGVVPQRARRPRPIVDYSFYGINDDTVKHAPAEAMQFGRALDRILFAVHTANPEHGLIYLLKLDQSDGFYRIPLKAEDIPKLGVVFPAAPNEEPKVALPLVLPMGWTESPPAFCAATETVTDLANELSQTDWDPPRHWLEEMASTPPEDQTQGQILLPPPPTARTTSKQAPLPTNYKRQTRHTGDPLYHADVFVDDGILAAQGTPATLNRHRRQLLHINDNVFRPNDDLDPIERKEPTSLKKLLQGDACWSTIKQLLGWIVDTVEQTITLPPHRADRLLEIVNTAKARKRWSPKFTHRLLGELRSMLLAIPGGNGLFSHLQQTLTTALRDRKTRFRPTREARQEIDDWIMLARDVAKRPTRLAELFPTNPGHYYGATDAAKPGFGGVILPQPTQNFPPYVWRAPLPSAQQVDIVSTDNPHGSITNSDLELAATVIHEATMATVLDVNERTIYTGCDNTPAVAWRSKGSVTTTGPAAGMLRYASLQQRAHRHIPRVNYIPDEILALASPACRDGFLHDLRLAKEKAKTAVNTDRANATTSLFNNQWIPFLLELNITDPFLADITDKVSVLRVFAHRVREGRCSRSGHPVRSGHVRDEVSHIAKTYTELGVPDPRLDAFGKMDPRLTSLYAAYKNEDPAPKRVKPMPIQVLFRAQQFVRLDSDPLEHATVDMAWIGLYYLLRPGEHCKSNENNPIQLKDITLMNGDRRLDLFAAADADILTATHSSITFDNQKNRERGEVIGHGIIPRSHRWTHVTSALITATLRVAAASVSELNYAPNDVTARSLRAGGAMALLCGNVDRDIIRLVGRWKSDAMFRYLHAQALPLINNLAGTILHHGAFTLLPGNDIPTEAPTVIA